MFNQNFEYYLSFRQLRFALIPFLYFFKHFLEILRGGLKEPEFLGSEILSTLIELSTKNFFIGIEALLETLHGVHVQLVEILFENLIVSLRGVLVGTFVPKIVGLEKYFW